MPHQSSNFNDKLDKILATDVEGEREDPWEEDLLCGGCGHVARYPDTEFPEFCVRCGERVR